VVWVARVGHRRDYSVTACPGKYRHLKIMERYAQMSSKKVKLQPTGAIGYMKSHPEADKKLLQ